MINPHLHVSLAAERRDAMVAQAQARRLAKQTRRARRRDGAPPLRRLAAWLTDRRPAPAPAGTHVALADGSAVLVRPVEAADAALLADGFARLGTQSRWLRFLRPMEELTEAELRFFTDVDHHDHEAIGALDPVDGRGVGIARYVRDSRDPELAEIAVTVVDDWQRRGLGTELIAQLSERAVAEGIQRFTALFSAENLAVMKLLRASAGQVVLVSRGSGTVEYEIWLTPDADSSDQALRRSA